MDTSSSLTPPPLAAALHLVPDLLRLVTAWRPGDIPLPLPFSDGMRQAHAVLFFEGLSPSIPLHSLSKEKLLSLCSIRPLLVKVSHTLSLRTHKSRSTGILVAEMWLRAVYEADFIGQRVSQGAKNPPLLWPLHPSEEFDFSTPPYPEIHLDDRNGYLTAAFAIR